MLVGFCPIHPVEPLLTQVANTRSELQPQQIEEGKEYFGVSGLVRAASTITRRNALRADGP